jgi:hypothetical protein
VRTVAGRTFAAIATDRVLDKLHGVLDLSHDHIKDRGGLIADIRIAGAETTEIGNGPACRDIEVGFLLIAGRHEEKDQEDPEGSSDEKHGGAWVTQWNTGIFTRARLSNRQADFDDFNKYLRSIGCPGGRRTAPVPVRQISLSRNFDAIEGS